MNDPCRSPDSNPAAGAAGACRCTAQTARAAVRSAIGNRGRLRGAGRRIARAVAARPVVAFARQSAMYLAHVVFGLELQRDRPRLFGRDRTTAATPAGWSRTGATIRRPTHVLAYAGRRLRRPGARHACAPAGAAMSGNARKIPGRAKAQPPTPCRSIVVARQHLELAAAADRDRTSGRANVTVDEAESPLAWLARRTGRDGRALIEPHQLQAGERLRADFTRAHTDAAHHLELGSAACAEPPRRSWRALPRVHRDDDRRAPARASGARRGRAGIQRAAARRLLLPQGLDGCRARTGLAVALGQGRAAARLDRLARHYGLTRRRCAGPRMRRCAPGSPRVRSSCVGRTSKLIRPATQRQRRLGFRRGCARPWSESRSSAAA